MSAVHQLSRPDARRIALRAQLLTAQRPTGLDDAMQRLSFLQLDPTNAIAPSADLVLWSRLGTSYSPGQLRRAVDEQRIIELRGSLRPAADLVLYRAEMAEWPGTGEVRNYKLSQRDWMIANSACRRDILERLRADGPLPKSELPDTCVRPWASSGWNNNKNVTMLLDLMVQCGEVAAAGGTGRDRLWDLAERVYPDDPPVPSAEARHLRDRRRLSALGIARSKGPECVVEPLDVGEVGEPAVIDGVRGEWRVDPALLGQPFEGRAALLSPFDRLLHDRKRMAEVFEFDYILEMYKPIAKRKWGYYALPIVFGDRLVGKLDAQVDRSAGLLRVAAIHEDSPFDQATKTAVRDEVEDLAAWLNVDVVLSDG